MPSAEVTNENPLERMKRMQTRPAKLGAVMVDLRSDMTYSKMSLATVKTDMAMLATEFVALATNMATPTGRPYGPEA